jgi:hypothetical protein
VFLGHFAVAMAAKKVAPRPLLGTLLMAALLADGLFGWLFVVWAYWIDRHRKPVRS